MNKIMCLPVSCKKIKKNNIHNLGATIECLNEKLSQIYLYSLRKK